MDTRSEAHSRQAAGAEMGWMSASPSSSGRSPCTPAGDGHHLVSALLPHTAHTKARPAPPSPLSLSYSLSPSDGGHGLDEATTTTACGSIGHPSLLQTGPSDGEEDGRRGRQLEPTPELAPGFILPPSILEQGVNKDGLPRRPMNAYMIFARWRRTELKGKLPDLNTGDVSSLLSAEWKSLDPTTKSVFVRASVDLKAQFDARHPDYKYIRRPNGTRKRGSRGGKMYIRRGQADDASVPDGQALTKTTEIGRRSSDGDEPTRWVSAEEEREDRSESEEDEIDDRVGSLSPTDGHPTSQPRRRAPVPSFPSFSRRVVSGPGPTASGRDHRRTVSQPYPPATRVVGSTPSAHPLPLPTQRYLPSQPPTIRIPDVPSMGNWASPSPQSTTYPSSAPYSRTASFADFQLRGRRPSACSQAPTPSSYPHSVPSSAPASGYARSPHLSTRRAMPIQEESRLGRQQQSARAEEWSPSSARVVPPPALASWTDGRLQVGLGLGSALEAEAGYGPSNSSTWKAPAAVWTAHDDRTPSDGLTDNQQYHAQWQPVPEQSPAPSTGSFDSARVVNPTSHLPPPSSRIQLPNTPSPTPYDPTFGLHSVPSHTESRFLPPPPPPNPRYQPHDIADRQAKRYFSGPSTRPTATSVHASTLPSRSRSATQWTPYPPLSFEDDHDQQGESQAEWVPLNSTGLEDEAQWPLLPSSTPVTEHSEYYGYEQVGSWGG